ncbi:MAG: MBL fold metallo-hydrolase [Deltaproteobacteria bacterium]|nr:MBL fold metallo-hydrolase [Deltaproteobacteria bacterium]
MKIKYYGVRGSVPTPGRDTIRYGGNTPCVAVWCGDDLVILDAGTGLRVLGDDLMQTSFGQGKGRAVMLVSHTHWDHIQGFPFFTPAYIKGNLFHLLGVHQINKGLEMAMHHQQQYQNFPVLLSQMPSRITFNAMEEGSVRQMGGIRILTTELNHPGGSFAYRIEYQDKVVVYATDTEHYTNVDLRLLTLVRDADVLIYDCHFTEEEYKNHRGWGHSTPDQGIRLAKEAGAKQLHLFHHNPSHKDPQMDEIVEAAQKEFDGAFAAIEGWEVEI